MMQKSHVPLTDGKNCISKAKREGQSFPCFLIWYKFKFEKVSLNLNLFICKNAQKSLFHFVYFFVKKCLHFSVGLI